MIRKAGANQLSQGVIANGLLKSWFDCWIPQAINVCSRYDSRFYFGG